MFEIIIERHDILKTSRVPDRSRPQGVFSEPTSREFSKCRPTGNVINVNPVSSFSAKIKRKFGHFVRFNHIGCFFSMATVSPTSFSCTHEFVLFHEVRLKALDIIWLFSKTSILTWWEIYVLPDAY